MRRRMRPLSASVSLPLVEPGEFADLAGSLGGATPIFRTDIEEPVIELQAEGDVTGVLASLLVRQPDSETFRLWEVAGTAHADAHLVVPEFWGVEQAHDFIAAFERTVVERLEGEGEVYFHVDPCRRQLCASCDVEPCPIRAGPFRAHRPLVLEEAVGPDPADPRE